MRIRLRSTTPVSHDRPRETESFIFGLILEVNPCEPRLCRTGEPWPCEPSLVYEITEGAFRGKFVCEHWLEDELQTEIVTNTRRIRRPPQEVAEDL